MKYLLAILLFASCGTAKINSRHERARIDSTGATAFDFSNEMEIISVDTKKKDSAVKSLKIENSGIEVKADFDTTGGGLVHVSVSDAGEIIINPGTGKVKNISVRKNFSKKLIDDIRVMQNDTNILHLKEITEVTQVEKSEVKKDIEVKEKKKDIKRGVLTGGIFAGIFIVSLGLIFYFRYKKETA